MPHRRPSNIYLGLMSGTSADGIDVAAVRIQGRGLGMRPEFVSHLHHDFPRKLHERLLAVMGPARTTTQELARLHSELGHAFADAALAMIERLGHGSRPVAIGLAGQTVCHLPGIAVGRRRSALRTGAGAEMVHTTVRATGLQGRRRAVEVRQHAETVTLQLGNAQILAARTGVPVIADFRQSDVAAGGQGAPLVPWTDWVLFHGRRDAYAVQNIGGIGNVTFIPAGGRPEDVVAFDTGPGNMIIDALVQRVTGGRERMDRDGRRARRGRVLEAVLANWMKHPFLQLPPPRTTGRETFGSVFVEAQLPRLRRASDNPDDWVATATAFTAATIADAYHRFLPIAIRDDAEQRELRAARNAGGQPQRGGAAGRAVRAARARAEVEGKSSDARYMRKLLLHPKASTLRAGRIASPGARGSGAMKSGSIAKSREPLNVVLCGGGARNSVLRDQLAAALPAADIATIDALGIPAEAKEAVSFAILARAALDGVPANLPQATGAQRPARLGARIEPP